MAARRTRVAFVREVGECALIGEFFLSRMTADGLNQRIATFVDDCVRARAVLFSSGAGVRAEEGAPASAPATGEVVLRP